MVLGLCAGRLLMIDYSIPYIQEVRQKEMLKPAYPDRFWLWLNNGNEHIYKGFVEIAKRMRYLQHKKRGAAKQIIEELRWDTGLIGEGCEFKINNNYAPGLARLAEAENSELKGFFYFREQGLDV